MSRCQVCRRAVNGATLCQVCTDDLEQRLAEIPALATDLDLTITRQTAMGNRTGSRATETPVAFNPAASIIAADLKATLAGWAQDIDPEQARDDIASLSRLLLYNLPAIRQHQQVDQLHDEITYAISQAWKAIDRPPNRSRVKVDDCLEVGCVGELIATFPLADYDPDDDSTHAKMTCDVCQITYPAEQWLHVGKRLLARAS